MKEVKHLDEHLYLDAIEILRIANEAIQKAKAENKKLGIPESFVKKGKLYYVLADGTISNIYPKSKK